MKIRAIEGQRWAVVAMLSIGASLGCQESPPPDSAEVEIESAESVFEPPADGRLTDEQVKMYAAVTRSASPPEGDPAAGVDREELVAVLEKQSPGDVGAASEPVSDTDEYQWVRARVVEAQLPDDAGLGDIAARMNAASLEATEGQRKKTSDPEEQARLAAQVAALKAVGAGNETRPRGGVDRSARSHNRELLERHLRGDDPPEPGQ